MDHHIINTPKDNAKSIEFRRTGNLYFVKKTTEDYLSALKLYNKAICFAPNNSENLCIAYANRSAVYCNLNMYEECLVNINLVNKIGNYPFNLRHILEEREIKCRTILSEDAPNDIEWNEPELNYPPHDKVPYIANCLEIRRNQEYGHHVVTNRDLKVGEIVAILKPFCTAQPGRYQYERCENCCSEHSQNLIPCPSCTAVMFCDEQCLEEAMNRFHKYECLAIDFINHVLPYQQEKLALRVVMSGLSIYNTIDQLMDMTERAFKKNVTIFDINNSNISDQYAVVSGLKKALELDTLNIDALNVFSVCKKIFNASNMVSKRKFHDYKRIFMNILEQHLLMVEMSGHLFDDLSYHIVNKRDPSYDEKDMNNNMSGIYPFMQLMPHSCVPNVLCSSYKNGKIVSIVRPIKAGEQLYHSCV